MGKGGNWVKRLIPWLAGPSQGEYAIKAQVRQGPFNTYFVRIRITFPLTYLAVEGRHIELILSPATDWDKFPADRLGKQRIIPTRQNSICDPQEGMATYTFEIKWLNRQDCEGTTLVQAVFYDGRSFRRLADKSCSFTIA